MKKIALIGGGFTGSLTAVHLMQHAPQGLEIILINDRESLHKGVAYQAYSPLHLLNVTAGKMSAYPDRKDHFLDWIMRRPPFVDHDRSLVSNAFMPRQLYGAYLCELWEEAEQRARSRGVNLRVIPASVTHLAVSDRAVKLSLNSPAQLEVDSCVIATGNQLPRNPRIKNMDFYNSPHYYQNPWKAESVKNLKKNAPVLIIGNGLTMVDTVLGLKEQGFTGKIYAISPNGFNILPHRHSGMNYSKVAEELREGMSIYELVALMNRHIKTVRRYGVSAEPIIDSLRPHTQRLWRSFTDTEKALFMARLRHLWGVARHRIPMHSHDTIQQLRIDGKLHICAGKILDMSDDHASLSVHYFDKKTQANKTLKVARMINCTGPETDLLLLDKSFLKDALLEGILTQDPLKLGIQADVNSFRVRRPDGTLHSNLFTLGSNLRGELWESTAISELRVQAAALAGQLSAHYARSGSVQPR